MAKELPSAVFDPKKMFETASEATQKGFMKAQEAQQRVTREMLEEVYMAGFKACMEAYGIKDDGIKPLLKG